MSHAVIIVETAPYDQMRYPTVGDFLTGKDGVLRIKVAEMADPRFVTLVAIHELIEATLCKADGVTDAEINAFDMAFTGEGEPGDDLQAPYRRQHLMATAIEKMVAASIGVDWKTYEEAVNAL